MYCHIELIPKAELPDDIEELLWWFLACLVQNGQILKNEYTIIKNGNYYLSVNLPKNDSFDEIHDGPYVHQNREKVKEYFDFKMIPMGENINSCEYCTCENRPAIEMETYQNDINSPFICCGCGKPIALYELPYDEGRDTYFETICWQDNYSAMDLLWLRCLSDRYTGNQLVNPDSALNRQGIEIARALEKKLGTKVYYHMFDDRSKKIKTTKVGDRFCRVCPKCGESMKHRKFLDDYELDVCDSCSLSSDCQ